MCQTIFFTDKTPVLRRHYMKKDISLEDLGLEIKRKRGNSGIRETAKAIDISPATLSRVENGKQPDLETFKKICKWLDVDAGAILGCSKDEKIDSSANQSLSVHLKADKNLSPKAASALASMIISAQQMLSTN